MVVSSSSVLNTRAPRKALCRPLVTVYTPPFCATSSPKIRASVVLGHHFVQGLVDLDGQMPRRQFLGQLVGAAVDLGTSRVEVGALGLGAHRVGRVRRQRAHDLFQRVQLGQAVGLFGCLEAARAGALVQVQRCPCGCTGPIPVRSPPSAAADHSPPAPPVPRSSATRSRSRCRHGPSRGWCSGAGRSAAACAGNARPRAATPP